MTLFFDSEVARKFGLKEAILFSHIAYWVAKNEANEKHFHEGRYWTYNSVNAFAKMFPFFSPKQLRTAIESLETQGLIITGNYNNEVLDRTTWYALTDYGLSICPTGQMGEFPDLPHRANAFAPQGKSYPITSLTKEYIEKEKGLLRNPKEKEKIDADFERFWSAYPKKLNKKDALKAFQKVNVGIETLLDAINAQKNSQQWRKEGGQFIPYPATWLRGEQWENTLTPSLDSNNNDEPSELFKQILGR